jgi:hypothetical protein
MQVHSLSAIVCLCLRLNATILDPVADSSFPNAVTSGQATKMLNQGTDGGESLGFRENKGQVCDTDGNPNPGVKYVLHQGSTDIFLLENGIGYQFTKLHYPYGYLAMMAEPAKTRNAEELQKLQKQIHTETYRMDMTLLGANRNCRISATGRSSEYANFYNHNVFDVHAFSKITYHDIYPGIDWVLYTKAGELKYDFVARPGADVSLIRLQFDHHEKLNLNKDGSFTVSNRLGSFTEKKPVSYQDGNAVETGFLLKNNVLSFSIGQYSRKQTLVIDPSVTWATYYGGTFGEEGYYCTVDAAGNVYLAGHTGSSGGIASSGHQSSISGSLDNFIVKFNSSGVRQWATYYGGPGNEVQDASCAVDGSGNVYLAGLTSSTAGIASSGHQNTYGGGTMDTYLVKFNSSGTRQWATYFGGNDLDTPGKCAVDPSGNIYLSGTTRSTVGIGSSGYQNTHSGGSVNDAFLVKFNTSGVVQWATYYGGTSSDGSNAVACDASGNVYLVGSTGSATNIASSGHQNTFGGSTDAYLVKFNSAGARQWATYYGGSDNDQGHSIKIASSGNIYLTGYTSSTVGIASSGHQNSFAGGSFDALLVKFNSSGVRQWATYYGGPDYDLGLSCDVDASDNVYLTGRTSSTVGIAASGIQNTYGGNIFDAYLVKFNSAGTLQWGTYYGDHGNDGANSCAVDPAGFVYLAGYAGSSVAIASGGHQNTLSGNSDAFLAKFLDCSTAPSAPVAINGNTAACQGLNSTFSVAAVAGASSYSWSLPSGWTGTSNTFSISAGAGASGNISVTASNACGASAPQTLAVSVNPLPTISVNSGSICSGNTFTMVPSGAATYIYSNGSNTASPTSNTNYSVTGTSSMGCLSTNTAVSSVSVVPAPTITVANPTYCAGQTPTLTGTGAVSFSITGAQPPPPQAMVRGFSAEGCMSAPYLVTLYQVPLPFVSVSNGSICSGKSFTLQPFGADTFTYSSGSAVVSPVITTTYSIIGATTEGCLSSNTAIATVSVSQTPTVSVNSGSICAGTNFTLTPAGASTFAITGGTNVVSPPQTTNYSVTGTSTAGCVSANTAIATVTVYTNPTITVNSGTICAGQVFTINPSGAAQYQVSGGNTTVSPAFSSSYQVTGTSTAGCVSSNTAVSSISVFALPVVTITGPPAICIGQTATLTAQGASTFLWNTNANTATLSVSPLTFTTYTVTGTDNFGCQNTSSKTVSVNALPNVSANASSTAICLGKQTTVNGTGAITYQWSGGVANNVSFSPTVTANYSVTGADLNGCAGSAAILVVVHNTPAITVSASSTLICSGNSVTLNGAGAAIYSWSGGVVNNVAFYPNNTTSYTVTGTDANGCQNTASIAVAILTLPQVSVSLTHTLLCRGESATLTVNGANIYSWSNGSQAASIIIQPSENTSYSVTGTDENGCSKQVVVTQKVDECAGVKGLADDVATEVFPNPNNGEFFIRTKTATKFEVYNGLGQVVFNGETAPELTRIELIGLSNGIYFLRADDRVYKVVVTE